MNHRLPVVVVGVALAIAGAATIWLGTTGGDEPAPLPTATWSQASPQPAPVTTGVATSDGTVTPDTMAPSRLLIPSLGVYTKIVDEPVDSGQLQLPVHTEVARYSDGGTVTGDTGTLLLAGHVSSYGDPGALKWLSRMQPGDWFYVTDSAGNRADYMAYGMQVKLKEDLPQDVFSSGGAVRAVLVTCGGKVVTRPDGSRHYDSNVLVYGQRLQVHNAR